MRWHSLRNHRPANCAALPLWLKGAHVLRVWLRLESTLNFVIPVQAGIPLWLTTRCKESWIPACAGMTEPENSRSRHSLSSSHTG